MNICYLSAFLLFKQCVERPSYRGFFFGTISRKFRTSTGGDSKHITPHMMIVRPDLGFYFQIKGTK